MLRKYLLPILAVLGVMFAVRTVILGNRPPVVAQPVAQPAKATFGSYVAGAGIVEASTENIAIGTPVGNVVTDVYVKVGDRVKKGEALFRLRDNVTGAILESKKAAVEASKAKLAKLESMPRPEDIPPAKARVAEAQANLEDLRDQLRKWESVQDKRAVAQEDLDRKRFAVRAAQARLATAESELKLLLAGAWKADIAIAQAELKQAEASVAETEAEVERRTIKAPVDATVLQVKVRPGEYAQPGPLATPLMLLGNTDVMHVRVDVDENDAWRIQDNAPAEASVRGNPALKTGLRYVRVEPYVVPKRSLTGDSSERVDTRVLQVIYSFDPKALNVKVGQQVDVFVEAPAVGG